MEKEIQSHKDWSGMIQVNKTFPTGEISFVSKENQTISAEDILNKDMDDFNKRSEIEEEEETYMINKLVYEGGNQMISYLLNQAIPNDNIPEQYRDVNRIKDSDPDSWHSEMQDEIDPLWQKQVWELVDKPQNQTLVKNQWVYAVKSDGRKRARLVAKGFSQIPR